MNRIDNITDDPNQLLGVVLDDGSVVEIALVYRPAIQRWTMDVTRGDFLADGVNVCTYPNLMTPWRENIPFGIGCSTLDGGDPLFLEDFVNGRASLFILSAADVAAIQATYLGAGVTE